MAQNQGKKTQEPTSKARTKTDKKDEEIRQQQDQTSDLGLTVEAKPPTVHTMADQVRNTWGTEARQKSMANIQRQLGNTYASMVAAEVQKESETDSLVQRHPEGADLVPEAPDAVEGLDAARSGEMPAAPRSGEGDEAEEGEAESTPAAEPETDAGEGAGGGAEAEAETGAEAGTEAGTEAETEAAEESEAPPAPVLGPTMAVAFSQQALQDAFSGVAGRDIIPGNITVVASRDELYAAYDQWCIDHNVTNSDTGVTWVAGDLARRNAARGLRTNAFAEPEPGTNIWVDASGTDPTATVHEMLHINTASGFRAAVGEIVNEGTTQRLAVRAVQATGSSVAGSENTYQREQEVVEGIANIVGDEVVTSAYFNGADSMITTYEDRAGENTWTALKALLDARNFDTALALLRNSGSQARIRQINRLLEGWVSDTDLAGIEEIYTNSSTQEKEAIRAAVLPQTYEVFWRSRTRRRVREIIEAS
jgi:hypothetical protein